MKTQDSSISFNDEWIERVTINANRLYGHDIRASIDHSLTIWADEDFKYIHRAWRADVLSIHRPQYEIQDFEDLMYLLLIEDTMVNRGLMSNEQRFLKRS